MASFDQKLRTLYLMEILLERTDEGHMLNASELCTILEQEYGISTDRRTIYTEAGETHFKAKVLVSLSSQFFGWITGIGSGMKMIGPEHVKQQYKEYLRNALENY